MSEFDRVREFAAASAELPAQPQRIPVERAQHLAVMMCSEIIELLQVDMTANAAQRFICDNISTDVSSDPEIRDDRDAIAAQCDALVDACYYAAHAAACYGLPLARVFDAVHAANMRKRWPDGEFHRRSDGKIIKPENWRAPDIRAVIWPEEH